MALPVERVQSLVAPRRIYGVGVAVLGLGNLSYGIGQVVAGEQLLELSLVQLVMGATLLAIGALVVTGSERLTPPDLSDRALTAIGVVGFFVGVYMLVGGLVLLAV
jgi:hypothetical protein